MRYLIVALDLLAAAFLITGAYDVARWLALALAGILAFLAALALERGRKP